MSESKANLEQILELLLAEENEKAEELLHEYVVGKARSEYEKVLDEAEATEVTHGDLEQAYNRIYQMTDEMGDEALEQMNHYAPKFSDALERADGDIDDIPAEEIPTYMAELDNAAFEMGAPEFVPFEAVDELNDLRKRAGIEIVEGAKIDCPCCKGGKDSCSHGKDVCGTCDGTGKVDEAYEAVVEAVVEEVAEVVTNSALNDAMAELKALAGI